jgi:uncharacterized protein (DUF2384 family)
MPRTAHMPKAAEKPARRKQSARKVRIDKTAPASNSAEKAAVISKAVINTAELLAIPQTRLAHTLGVSKSTVSRLHSGSYLLSPEKKEWELAVMLVRLFRSLDAIVGGIAEDARSWLNSNNHALAQRTPADMILTVEGLVRVVNYLDARRGIV